MTGLQFQMIYFLCCLPRPRARILSHFAVYGVTNKGGSRMKASPYKEQKGYQIALLEPAATYSSVS